MKYTGSTPMPDISLIDDNQWHSVPICCLNSSIQDVLRNVWKEERKFVMFKSELTYVSLCLNRGAKSVLLYFE